jgi:hypothetical protein
MLWVEGELRNTQMVNGLKCLVKKTTMERTCKHTLDVYIKRDILKILCMFFIQMLRNEV